MPDMMPASLVATAAPRTHRQIQQSSLNVFERRENLL